MTYHNPYSSTIPDVELGLVRRPEIDRKLDECLVNSKYPALVSIVIERGMGGPATVRHYLEERATTLSFRVVQCDVKTDLDSGAKAADFYRKLVGFVLKSREVSPVPTAVVAIAQRIERNTDTELSNELRSDFFEFFRLMREADTQRPLLLVFYNFDRLPQQFPFSGRDWAWLRDLHDDIAYRLYYAIVSRRSLGYIERLHGLQDSLFAARFSGNVRRVSLLTPTEAERIVDEAARNGNPWPGWLRAKLLEWGGNHPYCLQRICFEMYNRLFQHGEKLDARAAESLTLEWLRPDYLGDYFERLHRNLERDHLLEPLTRALSQGYHSPHHDELSELVAMGYFPSHPAYPPPTKMTYDRLFSPLFQSFLTERSAFPSAGNNLMSGVSATRPATPKTMPPDWPPAELPCEPLTPREAEALWLMAVEGFDSDKELADKMVISVTAAAGYFKVLREKFRVSRRSDIIRHTLPFISQDNA